MPGVKIDPRLRERSFGVFEGLTADECARTLPEAWSRYQADRPAFRPAASPRSRWWPDCRPGCRRRPRRPGGAPVLVVGHGGAIRALLHASFGRPFPPMANGYLFRLEVHDGQLREIEDLGA